MIDKEKSRSRIESPFAPYADGEVRGDRIDIRIRFGYHDPDGDYMRFKGELKNTMKEIRKKFDIDIEDLL